MFDVLFMYLMCILCAGTPTEQSWPGIGSNDEFVTYNYPQYKADRLSNHTPRYTTILHNKPRLPGKYFNTSTQPYPRYKTNSGLRFCCHCNLPSYLHICRTHKLQMLVSHVDVMCNRMKTFSQVRQRLT